MFAKLTAVEWASRRCVCVACAVCLTSVTKSKHSVIFFSHDLIYVAGCFLSQCISVNVFQMDVAHYP